MPEIKAGTTNVRADIKLVDPTSGDEEVNLTITSLVMWYHRPGAAVVSAAATQSSSLSAAHVDNRMIQVHATTAPGLYQCDWPDGAFAAGVPEVVIGVKGTAVDTAMEKWVLKDFDISDIEDYVSDIYSDTTALVPAVSDVKSELVIVSDAVSALTAKQDSDMVIVAAATSDIKSELVVASDAVSALTAKQDSDMVIVATATSDIKSDCVVIEAKIDSDALLADADHDKTQSDIADLSTKQDSDMVVVAAATSDVKSELVVASDAVSALTAKQDSDMVVVATATSDIHSLATLIRSDTTAIETIVSDVKSELVVASDATSALTAKQDSDMVIVATATSDIHSLATLIRSDTTAIEGAGGGLTAGQASQLLETHSAVKDGTIGLDALETIGSDVHSLLTLVRSDTTAIEAGGGALTSAQAAQLTTIASDVLINKSVLSDNYSLLTLVRSDTTVIETVTSDIQSDTNKLVSDVTATPLSDLKVYASDVESNVVVVASQVLINKSAVSDTLSLLTLVRSDTTVIEGASGGLTSAQAAQLTTIASDLVLVYSDTTAIDSELTLVHSETTAIQSDAAAVESELILVHSETTAAQSNAALLDAAQAELAAVPAANAGPLAKLNWLFLLARNKLAQTGALQTVYADDAATPVASAALTDDGTTNTRAEWA